MQEINQILFVLFALILSGIFISTFVDKDQHSEMFSSHYWRWAIVMRISAYLCWAIAPIFSNVFLTPANFSMMSSGVLLVLLYRSWRKDVPKSLEITCFLIILAITVLFEFIRQSGAPYKSRVMLVGPVSVVTSLWACYELIRYHAQNKSGVLKVLIAVVVGQVLFTTFLVGQVFIRSQEGIIQFTQERALIELWGTVSVHLLSFILTSSFLYQQLFISKSKTYNALQEKRKELVDTTKEKEEVKALLIEREELIRSLIHANKTALTGALSASVAHEINQPIGAINLNLDFINIKLQKNEIDNQTIQEVIDNIRQDSDRISAIVSSLKTIFKHDDIQAKDTNLSQFVLSLSEIFKSKVIKNCIDLKLDLQTDTLVRLNQDAFQQVILNLINNAIDAVSSVDQSEKKISIETRNGSNEVHLIISDNGPGLPDNLKEVMFSLMKTNKVNGLGLGLWLSRYIVNRHAGTIHCDNNPKGGARFTISLPFSESNLAVPV